MRILILLLCLGVAGCSGRKLAPSCEVVADHVQTLFGGAADGFAVEARKVFAARCAQDQWPPAMRSCLVGTRSLSDPKNCKQQLTAEQTKALDTDLAAIEQREAMKVIPPACLRYEILLGKVMTCSELPQDVRDQLKATFEEFKATWPAVADKRTLGPVCGNAIVAVRQATSSCAGAAKW